MKKSITKTPAHVDALVGKRVRARRLMVKMSQQELAKALRITFQQVQKYENGVNRISCSRLSDIARVLRQPVSWFFNENHRTPKDDLGTMFLAVAHSARLAQAYVGMKDRHKRDLVVRLAETIAA